MPRVSVAIPAYNAAAFLGLTLETCLRSTYDDFEVVVVDDGSVDGTAEVASRFGPRVKVISQANAGMSASRNRAIASSASEFVALLDSDDVWHPEKLRLQVEALEANREAAFCFTEFTVWNGGDVVRFMNDPRTGRVDPGLSGWIYHRMLQTNWALPSSVLLRRTAWESLGPFLCEDQQTDDWEYLVRASFHFQFIKLAESMVLYRKHPASLSRKVAPINRSELLREAFIGRFGTRSPNGAEADKADLDRRRYFGWRTFADSHCARGNVLIGLRTYGRLIAAGPHRAATSVGMAKSLVRRVFPR